MDDSAGGTELRNIVIDAPATRATVAGIRWGATGSVHDSVCTNTFVRAAAPIGFQLLKIGAHFVGNHCRSVANEEHEWVIGSRDALVESFHCVFCSSEPLPGNVGIVINNAVGFSWSEGYFECGGSATAFCVDIPSDAQADQISISNNFVGGDSSVPGTSAFIHSALSTATLTIIGNRLDYVFADGAYILEDDAVKRATIIGNTMNSAGSAVYKKGSHVCALGNTTASISASRPCT